MKTLNLIDLSKSDIKYQIQKFPDGQQNVVILGEIETFRVDEGHPKDYYWEKRLIPINGNYIQIKSRLNNFLDLELIVCAVASLRLCGVKEIHLYVPYILGARSDRKFEIGGNRYIKDVIAPILNSLNFESVTCYDPHSYVLENCINNFESITNVELVRWAISDLKGSFKSPSPLPNTENIILVSPDAGANKKIFKVAEQIGYTGDIITCSKSRDVNGKITHVVVPIKYEETKDIIIIDDICDGGATFNNISAALNDAGHQGKKYLIISHGIFSKGFDDLFKYFDGIYCTNSYSDILKPMEKGTMSGVHTSMKKNIINRPDNEFVKQLNVF